MNSSNPIPDPNLPHPMTPSTSVMMGAAVGTPAVMVISWVLDVIFKVQVPPEVAAAAGSLIGAVFAYFGNGGRAIHTA